MTDDIRERLLRLRLLAMDVDGTLTDGGMYYTSEGSAMKRFFAHDGMGITLLQRAGIEVAFISSEQSDITHRRGLKLGVKHIILGSRSKHTALTELADTLGIPLGSTGFIGDDVNDITVCRLLNQHNGFTSAPANAVEQMKNIVSYVCRQNGGYGAVRELADLILHTQLKPTTLPDDWH